MIEGRVETSWRPMHEHKWNPVTSKTGHIVLYQCLYMLKFNKVCGATKSED
jgi:hypothetical protein